MMTFVVAVEAMVAIVGERLSREIANESENEDKTYEIFDLRDTEKN